MKTQKDAPQAQDKGLELIVALIPLVIQVLQLVAQWFENKNKPAQAQTVTGAVKALQTIPPQNP